MLGNFSSFAQISLEEFIGCLGLVDALVRVSSALNHIFQGMRTKLEVFNQY